MKEIDKRRRKWRDKEEKEKEIEKIKRPQWYVARDGKGKREECEGD